MPLQNGGAGKKISSRVLTTGRTNGTRPVVA
jgi:hypothetical protein